MLDVLERCFATQLKSADWQTKMKAIVPSYGQSLIEDADLLKNVRDYNLKTLNLV